MKFIASIINFIYPSTVQGVLGSFQKTVNNLHKVSARQNLKADKLDAQIEKLWAKADDKEEVLIAARIEANNASALAARISDQFGLTV